MRAIDALHAPWAIRPENLKAMLEVYERHANGEQLDLSAVEAALGKPLSNAPQPYEVIDGVAVINCVGVLGKRFDMFTQICGGASTQRLQEELQAALSDDAVSAIVLNVDSPGGEVDGTQALATDVYNARSVKPVVALIDGVGASAAYWIASAASRVFITGDTTAVGSIGVVIAHTDVSKAQEMRGVKTTEITAGKFKRVASTYAPLSTDGRDSLQTVADHIYSVFVSDVARNLGVSEDTVLADMADGRLFLGEQAINAGLVHGMSTLAALIQSLSDGTLNTGAGQSGVSPTTGATAPVMKGKIEMENVIVCGVACGDQDAVNAAVETVLGNAKTEARNEGVKAERERIAAINKLSLAGHDALISKAIEDGTPAADVAVAVITAEKDKRAKLGADLTADAPAPVPPAAAPADTKPAEPDAAEVAGKARQYQATLKAGGKLVSIADAVAHVRKEMGLSK